MIGGSIRVACALAACVLAIGCTRSAENRVAPIASLPQAPTSVPAPLPSPSTPAFDTDLSQWQPSSAKGLVAPPLWAAPSESAAEQAARLENELPEWQRQQVLRLAAGLSPAERSEITRLAAEQYAEEQQERRFPPSVQASMACWDAEWRANLPGLAVLAFHARTAHEARDSYPTLGETRALSAMHFRCPEEAPSVVTKMVAALARHQMTWGDMRRRIREGAQAEDAKFQREEAAARQAAAQQAAQQAAAQEAAQQAAAQQDQQCRQLAGVVMLQTTPIDAAEAQQIQRCPQLARFVMFRNMIRATNNALRATEPSAPQSWHCQRSFLGGVDCDSQ